MVTEKDLHLIHELREQGVEWDVIADTIPNYTDNDRKVYKGWLMGRDSTQDNDLIKNAKTLQSIRLARKQLGIERSINNEQIRDIALHQTFTDQVLSAIKDRYSGFRLCLDWADEYKGNTAHIFTLADFHYDGDVDYLDVIKEATKRIIEVILEKELYHVYIAELGDTIDGASLRTSQLMAVKKGMVDQVMDVADAYIQMLVEISSYAHVTFISVDSSNHTQLRNLGTKQNQLVEEDLMKIFNRFIELALPDLEMYTDDDVSLKILGYNFFFAHGHLVKSKEKYLEAVQMDRDTKIDFGFFGHFHHQRSIDLHSSPMGHDKKAFYVPALSKRYSPYERDKNLSSAAGVGYYVFEKGKGQVEERKLKV